MAITNSAQLQAAIRKRLPILLKTANSNGENIGSGPGYGISLWTCGPVPTAGLSPGSVAGIVPTNATVGALGQLNPGGGNTLYLGGISGAIGPTTINQGTLVLYDRLVSTDGLSGNLSSFTVQPIGTPSLTRYTSGVDVEAWLEFYTATGVSPVSATISYTNTVPSSGQVSGSAPIVASPGGRCIVPIPLAAGDLGVTAVASLTMSGATGTAGNLGITLVRRLASITMPVSGFQFALDYMALNLPPIQNNACLAMAYFQSNSGSPFAFSGQVLTLEG